MPPYSTDSNGPLRAADATDATRRTSGAEAPSFESVVGMLSLAVVGTTLAGAAFPLILGVCIHAMRLGSGWISDGGYFFSFVLLGGMIGGMLAFTVSLPVALLAGVIAWLSRISTRDVWFASLVGGWTGFFATHLVLEALPSEMSYLTITGIAVITGQLGAGGFICGFIARMRQKHGRSSAACDASPGVRIGLRQLFGITTSVALVAAFSQSLKENERAYASMGYAAVIQAAVIGIAIAVKARRSELA